MNRRRGLTRVELLVVVGVVVFILFSVLQIRMRMRNVRRHTPPGRILCQVNLKQWGLVFKLYTDDHDGSFVSGKGGDSGKRWFEPFRPPYKDKEFWFCPAARKLYNEGGRNPFGAWKVMEVSGSYGLNGWMYNPQKENTGIRGLRPPENHWGTTMDVRGSDSVPVLADAMWIEGWPRHNDSPSDFEKWPGEQIDYLNLYGLRNGLRNFCVNRHEGYLSVLFMDYSVRKVGLKELWTLKWHRNYDAKGPWTEEGGVQPDDWPLWMQEFEDY